jgi:hypothetical protein
MDRDRTGPDCLVFDSVPERFRSLLLKMSSERFVSLTEDELREITDGKDAKSTKNSTKYAANTFRTYLRNKNLHLENVDIKVVDIYILRMLTKR